ncbi:MAG TPA: hypothetical protein VJQ54_11365 [Candidatus Sulfotelmatobacter sp.]|nr:hypothetical protein [Candidatus Sulfotelmatobacter sp.]
MAQTELTGASAGISDGQNPERVSLTTRAFRTALAMAGDPVDERAAENFACHREAGKQLVACLNHFVRHRQR